MSQRNNDPGNFDGEEKTSENFQITQVSILERYMTHRLCFCEVHSEIKNFHILVNFNNAF